MWLSSERSIHLHHVARGELQQHQGVFPVHALVVGVARQAQLPGGPALRRHLAEELRRRACRQELNAIRSQISKSTP